MLKPEDARRELARFVSDDHLKARCARLKKLPKVAAEAGFGLLRRKADGTPFAPNESGYYRQPDDALGRDATIRGDVLAALFPTFVDVIESGVGVFRRLPFALGSARRPFRAPNRPELSIGRIASYVGSAVLNLSNVDEKVLAPDWVAAWAVHLRNPWGIGPLLAGQIDAGHEQVYEILKDSAAGRHAIGGPNRAAIGGLLSCGDPEAWDFVAGLLLAAQRQEGLRQVILESVDEAHPQAFRKMLDFVIDQDLVRFASVARAASVWLGEELMVEDTKALKNALSTVAEALNDPGARARAIESGDPAASYRGLWALAFEDFEKAVDAARPILREKDTGRNIAALKLLAESGTTLGEELVQPLLHDSDPTVLAAALAYYVRLSPDAGRKPGSQYPPDLFETLEAILPALPDKPKAVPSPVPSWRIDDLHAEPVADLLDACLQDRPVERLLPWLRSMSTYRRVAVLGKLCSVRTLSSQVRETLLACAAETNTAVREAALEHLKKCKLAEDEARTLEKLLTRKPPDFRRGVFELLLGRADKLAVQSAERLLAGDAMQRAGGVEIARRLVEAGRATDAVRSVLIDYLAKKGAKLPDADRAAIDRILTPEAAPATLENGLGLFDPADRSPIVKPRKQKVQPTSQAAVAFLKSLDALIHEHRSRTFTVNSGDEIILGSIQWYSRFPSPDPGKTREENLAAWPLKDLWLDWYTNRPRETRDPDGLESIRAMALDRIHVREGDEADREDNDRGILDAATRKAIRELHPMPGVRLRYKPVVDRLLDWFLVLFTPQGTIEFLLDAAEHALACVPESLLADLPDANDEKSKKHEQDWRVSFAFRTPETQIFRRFLPLTAYFERLMGEIIGKDEIVRLFRLHRWLEEPRPGANRIRVDLNLIVKAYRHGAATLADFYDHLIGPRMQQRYSMQSFESLDLLTNERRRQIWPALCSTIDEQPALREALQKTLDRIVEIELARGETPTAATEAATAIRSYSPSGVVFRLMDALGKTGFRKGSYFVGNNKPEVLTHLIQALTPTEAETPEAFAAAARPWIESGRIPLDRFVALGLVNTKLMNHAAAVVKWPGYEEACYWFMAHADGGHAHTIATGEREQESESSRAWRAVVKQRSNLTAEQRADGVIDVNWFHVAYAALNDDARWDEIEKAARFLGYGHAEKKAARLADVLLGRTSRKDLVEGIEKRYLKESVKLLGLLPLPAGAKARAAEVAARCEVLKAYERYARGLSSLTKEPAMQAYRLGMENLAVTAGYADPVRLEWAVSARETADLAKGPVSVKVKDVTVTLALGDFAEPVIIQSQKGKELKSLPKEAKAAAAVSDLLERRKDLKRLAASTKRTLEAAMCSGDRFSAAELKALMGHAIVKPFLERLVLKTDRGLGYPVDGGKAVRSFDGTEIPVKGEWSIAHPLDFVAAKTWHGFQAECFAHERIQPFKQVFREVYTLTPAEKEDGDKSRRYSGHQVNENQAKSLLAGRGWSTREELSRLYRAEGLIVDLELDHGYTTPAEAAAPAVGQVVFRKRDDWKPIRLEDVPPVIFSEVMRDLDLVVSVAHVGGVDPEATQSTIEMRRTLLEETCQLLKLENVRLEGKHALIQGEYGHYSVHLGSGVVHKQPGGSLCVVAVPAQHRGRLFLPFADDDPRTAEVVSKVLLLARDREIQDPTILEQIAAR